MRRRCARVSPNWVEEASVFRQPREGYSQSLGDDPDHYPSSSFSAVYANIVLPLRETDMAYLEDPPGVDKYVQHPGDIMTPSVSPNNCPFKSLDWGKNNLSKHALLRCKKEIKTIANQPSPDIYFLNDEEQINCFKVLVIGPENTPYEGGFFHFFARLGPNYPNEPPRVCAMSCYRFGHLVRFSPNMYRNGHICLSILNTWQGEKWTPDMDLRSLFLGIRSRFTSQAYCKEPLMEIFENLGVKHVWLYDLYVRHETLRVTVVEGLRTWEKYCIPAKLVRHMVANFFECYDSYVAACHTYKVYDGAFFVVPLVPEPFVPNFTGILKDLIKLHEEILPFKDRIFGS